MQTNNHLLARMFACARYSKWRTSRCNMSLLQCCLFNCDFNLWQWIRNVVISGRSLRTHSKKKCLSRVQIGVFHSFKQFRLHLAAKYKPHTRHLAIRIPLKFWPFSSRDYKLICVYVKPERSIYSTYLIFFNCNQSLLCIFCTFLSSLPNIFRFSWFVSTNFWSFNVCCFGTPFESDMLAGTVALVLAILTSFEGLSTSNNVVNGDCIAFFKIPEGCRMTSLGAMCLGMWWWIVSIDRLLPAQQQAIDATCRRLKERSGKWNLLLNVQHFDECLLWRFVTCPIFSRSAAVVHFTKVWLRKSW